MDMEVPIPGESTRPLKVTVNAAPGTIVLGHGDPCQAAVQVPIARVPVTDLLEKPTQESPTPSAAAAPSPAIDLAALPDDPAVLKQMIAEWLRALRTARRDRAEVE